MDNNTTHLIADHGHVFLIARRGWLIEAEVTIATLLLTVVEFAEAIEKKTGHRPSKSAVRTWCRDGLVTAYRVPNGPGRPPFRIPATEVNSFVPHRRGRKRAKKEIQDDTN